ncbi:MAG: acyltransferase family protein, partial [Lysinibacillus sp.]
VGLAKRLFPQALFVSLVTGIAAFFIIPKVQWEALVTHIFASTFYFENWRLAIDSVDYLARDNATSPFQHFWSLSVQGQFYIIWPLVIVIAFTLARVIFKTPIRKTLLTVLLVLFTASLSYSIYKTDVNQPWAYFDTFARVWEFSIGGMFALLLPYLRMNKYISTVTGWLGILVICLTGIVLPVSTVFPGYLALVPISGALLVLVASENSTKLGIDKFLGLKPFVFLGGLTYGFYLWHWPLLIFYQTAFETQTVSLAHGALILLATLVLSYISTHLVERPIRTLDIRRNKFKLYGSLSTLLVMVVAMTVGYAQYVNAEKEKATITTVSAEEYPGARVLYEDVEPEDGVELIPPLLTLKQDIPAFYKMKECLSRNLEEVRICHFGVTENPDYTVAVVGGSHAAHWMPAIEILAEEMNFQIDLYSHDGCRFTTPDPEFKFTDTCLAWNENLIEILKQNPPDLVFVPSTLNKREVIPQGFIDQWVELDGYTHIFGIRDNPRMEEKVPECLERVDDVSECSVARDEALSKVAPWDNTPGIPDNVYFADLSDYFCDEERCYSVIGNIIVYRDDNHVTTEYMKTLAPMLKIPLQEAFDLLDSGTFEQHRKSDS